MDLRPRIDPSKENADRFPLSWAGPKQLASGTGVKSIVDGYVMCRLKAIRSKILLRWNRLEDGEIQ